jgi:hypothetical protein
VVLLVAYATRVCGITDRGQVFGFSKLAGMKAGSRNETLSGKFQKNQTPDPDLALAGKNQPTGSKHLHSLVTKAGMTRKLARPSAHLIISGRLAAGVHSRAALGVIPTLPKSSRSASQQVWIVISG